MLEFLRTFRPILDRPVKVRLALAAGAASVLAIMDAIGILLILPLVQTLDGLRTDRIPSSADPIANLLHDPTPGKVAVVLAVLVFIAFLAKAVLAIAYLKWSFHFLATADAQTSTRLMRAYLDAPWTFHLQRNAGELMHTLGSATALAFQAGLANIVGTFADIAVLVGIAVVLLVVDPLVAVLIAVYLVAVALGYRYFLLPRSKQAGEIQTESMRRATRVTHQSLGATKEIIVGRRQDHFVRTFGDARAAAAESYSTLMLLGFAPRYYLEVALILGVGLTGGLLFQIRSTASAVAVLAMVLAAGFRALPSMHRLLATLNAVRGYQPALDLVVNDITLLGLPPAEGPRQAEPSPLPPATLEFRDVKFRYEENPNPVLTDVSFIVAPASQVAFVGLSGAGKTTMLDLLIGLLEPQEGRILVDDHPLTDVREAWQLAIGYVPQEVTLVDETIRANIAFGYEPEEIDERRLAEAVRLAQLDDFVASLPDGLDARTGDYGVRVSGGQRQRIGIARALYHEPSTLVLDEATSSLDSQTERLITDTVDSLHGNLTIITVSHRLSTVRHSDTIHYLEDGRLVASGTFDELCTTTPTFAHLASLQGMTGELATPSEPG